MRRGVRVALLAILGVAAAAIAGLAAWAGLAAFDPADGAGLREIALALVALGALFALWHAATLIRLHFHEIERLRGALVALSADSSAVVPRQDASAAGLELQRLHMAVSALAARRAAERAAPDARLSAVLASITEAMVVITARGQVSLVNHAARTLLGAERVKVGTSIFDALERHPLLAAIEGARSAGRPVSATLRSVGRAELDAKVAALDDGDGAVLTFSGEGVAHRAEVEHDLELHDQPPRPTPVAAETPLRELPITVFDTETTGLDVGRDRIVSIGGVRLHGARAYRSASFDRLVNPGIPIPSRSTAVHGITDGMVADAPRFPEVLEALRPALEGTVLVGHNVPFDLAMLRREAALAGVEWREPLYLDTLLLCGALNPPPPALGLEDLAGHFGVTVYGRHTALGDALVTAEIYLRLLPLLKDAGVTTYGEAVAFGARAKHLIARQKAAGW